MNNTKDELRKVINDGLLQEESVDTITSAVRYWIARQLQNVEPKNKPCALRQSGFDECLKQVKSNLLNEGQ